MSRDKLSALEALQKVDLQIRDLAQQAEKHPARLKQIEAERNQARAALDAAADAVARFLLPRADGLDAVVLGGDASAIDALRADRRLTALLSRAEPRVLDVPEPRRAVLDEAARRVRAVEVVVHEPEPRAGRVR